MGRDLHYTIPKFIEKHLKQHEKVVSLQRIDDLIKDDDYIYIIKRSSGLSDVVMHASDEYMYTLSHYFQKPTQITAGGFILIAKPEAKYVHSIAETSQHNKISIGKWGALLGALNHENHWEYIPPERHKTVLPQ